MDGHQLPAPFGLGLTIYTQNQDYRLARLHIDVPDVNVEVAEALPVVNRTESYHLKLDHWVLPFLNVYALGGWLETTTRVKLSGIDVGLPFTLDDLVIDNDGWVYGGGLTLVGGYGDFFATLTGTYTEADLTVTNSSISAWVVTPKVGYVFGEGSVWVGAMHQDAEERHEGTYAIPYLGEVPFTVELHEAEPWNYLVGAVAGLTEHWVLTFEAGFGDRDSVLMGLEYRF
jgi:hypothetical protein